jgi:hypothetical protein
VREVTKRVASITSKEDFLNFVELLIKDLQVNPNDWENQTLESYLEAIAGWTEGMEGYYANTGQHLPKDIPWKVLADILMAASMYE